MENLPVLLDEMQSQEFHIVSYRGTVIYPVNTSRK